MKSPLKYLRESLKNYKYIIVDGCSFVKGHGCEICDLPFRGKGKNRRLDTCSHRFSSILSKKIGATEIMIGGGGKSNIEILNSLYTNLNDYKDKSEECLVIIGSTHWMRGEYMSVDAEPLHFNFGTLCDDVINDIPMIGKHRLKDILVNRLKREPIMKSFERQYNLTLHWLESLGFDYVFFNSFHEWEFENQITWDFKKHQHEPIREIKSWKLWINMYDDFNKPENSLTASDGHPSIYAHKEMAEKIYDFIRRD